MTVTRMAIKMIMFISQLITVGLLYKMTISEVFQCELINMMQNTEDCGINVKHRLRK